MKRPELNAQISVQDFKDFYWLKQELVDFCKKMGISTEGGKIALTQRIVAFLETGVVEKKPLKTAAKPQSKFDWNNTPLDLNTLITDNYKNTENVRQFMTQHIGSHFHFTTVFMKWLKQNAGKILADAIEEWQRLHELKKNKNHISEIDPQFEYNRYIRAFLADNPDKTRQDAVKYWNLKRQQRGSKAYNKTDLEL
jgi:hypothetical protein